jgi:hypothetical protein
MAGQRTICEVGLKTKNIELIIVTSDTKPILNEYSKISFVKQLTQLI